jgi:hypothetical protein
MTHFLKYDFMIKQSPGSIILPVSGAILKFSKGIERFVHALFTILLNNLTLTNPSCPKSYAMKCILADF